MATIKHELNFPQTLKSYRVAAKLSQEELAHRSGLDRTYISMLERGIKSPTLNTLFNICEALNISFASMARQMTSPTNDEDLETNNEIKLPLMGSKVACGSPVGDDHYIEKEITLDKFLIKNPEQTFFVRASGNSMNPTIQNNDLLIIDKIQTPKSGQIILAQIENEFTVKRFIKEGKAIKLKADNPLYSTIEITADSKFTLCGLITSIIRNNP